MRALAKVRPSYLLMPRISLLSFQLVTVNNPDKIIFVGEALVGNEAVDQLKKFDRAMRDFSSGSGSGKERGIDGMLVTKWDTVDDKVRCICVSFLDVLILYPVHLPCTYLWLTSW